MKTIVYVDGFNLYYGAIKGTKFHWLDISKMCHMLLPGHQIDAIKYFTAYVKPRMDDPDQPMRQQTYLRALRTIPNLEIILGHFLSHKVHMPLAEPTSTQKYVRVIKTEEKGSDVNIAAHLICDGYENKYDAAVLISNDSDLAEPVRIVKERLNKKIGILNPHKHPSKELSRYSNFLKQIRQGVLHASLFADQLTDMHGVFHKPVVW